MMHARILLATVVALFGCEPVPTPTPPRAPVAEHDGACAGVPMQLSWWKFDHVPKNARVLVKSGSLRRRCCWGDCSEVCLPQGADLELTIRYSDGGIDDVERELRLPIES